MEQQNTLHTLWNILKSKFNEGENKGIEHKQIITNKLRKL